jgi:hypothetical protein
MLFFVFILLALATLIFIVNYRYKKAQKLFKQEYREFLLINEGLELFCYTSRSTFCDYIESNILPNLDPAIRVIKMEGKNPITNLPVKFISYALYHLEHPGFPNLMKIKNGAMKDISLHNPIYNAINNKKYEEITDTIQNTLIRLRS